MLSALCSVINTFTNRYSWCRLHTVWSFYCICNSFHSIIGLNCNLCILRERIVTETHTFTTNTLKYLEKYSIYRYIENWIEWVLTLLWIKQTRRKNIKKYEIIKSIQVEGKNKKKKKRNNQILSGILDPINTFTIRISWSFSQAQTIYSWTTICVFMSKNEIRKEAHTV